MEHHTQGGRTDNNNTRVEPDTSVALDQFNSVHRHLHERLCQELAGLEARVNALRQSTSMHSAAIIRTYERMIRDKRDFMERWGMDPSCGCR